MTTPKSKKSSATLERLVPWLVAVAFFMEALDTTILNTAIPAIASALYVPPLSMKAVLSSYTLAVAVFVPVSGWMADRFGTRIVFSSALGIFTLASLLCGLSNSIHMLVACRVLQGLGGAMMVPVGRLTLVRTFPKSELVRAMSFVAVPALIGPMLGPVIGGFIVHYLSWRAIFFVNLPIGLVGLYLIYRHLPDYRADKSVSLDWVGLIMFSSGVALLSYVMEIFGAHTMGGYAIAGLLGIAIVLLAGYTRHSMITKRPLLNLTLFRLRTFRIAVAGSFITRLGAGGVPFLLPLLYQVGLGYSPIQAALFIMPQPLAAISLKLVLSRILATLGYRRLLLLNTIAMGGVIMLFGTIGLSTPVWIIIAQAFAFGLCSSMQYSSMNSLVYADVAVRDTSMASTISSTMQQLSLSFGVAVASLTAAVFVPDRFNNDATQLIHGIDLAFLTLGSLTIVSGLIFAFLKPKDGSSISNQVEKL